MLLTTWRHKDTGATVIVRADNIFCVDNLSIHDITYLVERASTIVITSKVRNEDRMAFPVNVKNDSKLFETFVVFVEDDVLWTMPKSVFLKEYERVE